MSFFSKEKPSIVEDDVSPPVVTSQSSLLVSESTPLILAAKQRDTMTIHSDRSTIATLAMSMSISSTPASLSEKGEEEMQEERTVLGSVVVFETNPINDGQCENCNKDGTWNVYHQQDHAKEEISQEGELPAEEASLLEGVTECVHEVAEALMEELHEADDGDRPFLLEMGLTRNLSILPGDVTEAAAAAQPPPPPPPFKQDDDLEAHMSSLLVNEEERGGTSKNNNTATLSACLLLLGTVVCMSSVGPLLQIQGGASPALKLVWRMIGTSLILLPFVAVDGYKNGLPRLSSSQVATLLFSTVCYDILSLAFFLSLEYTDVGNALILANSQALILLIGKFFVGDAVSFLEGGGALVAFSGAALCSKDSAERGEGADPSAGGNNNGYTALYGDALAVCSAIGGVGYLVFAKVSRQHMSLYMFMFLTMAIGCMMILFFQIVILQEYVTFDRHPNHGIFGFLILDEVDRLPLELMVVVVCNFFGTMGYVRSMQYFDNLIISSVALLEPVVAEFLSFGFGVGTLPGWQGWVGNVLVAAGTLAVVYNPDATPTKKNNNEWS